MYLSKNNKSTVREIAARNWRLAKSAYPASPRDAHLYANQWTERDIINRREEFGRGGFGSIITSIIISLAIRFATKLLLRWLEEEFGE